jgi:hypothetical protein
MIAAAVDHHTCTANSVTASSQSTSSMPFGGTSATENRCVLLSAIPTQINPLGELVSSRSLTPLRTDGALILRYVPERGVAAEPGGAAELDPCHLPRRGGPYAPIVMARRPYRDPEGWAWLGIDGPVPEVMVPCFAQEQKVVATWLTKAAAAVTFRKGVTP